MHLFTRYKIISDVPRVYIRKFSLKIPDRSFSLLGYEPKLADFEYVALNANELLFPEKRAELQEEFNPDPPPFHISRALITLYFLL